MFLNCRKDAFREGRNAAPSFAFFSRCHGRIRHLGLAAFLVFLTSLIGCQKEAGSSSKFVDAFVEMRVVEMVYGADSPSARILRQEIIKKHGFTREQFLAETDKILEDETRWLDFQKEVVALVDTLLADRKPAVDKRENAPMVAPHPPPVKPSPFSAKKRKGGDD